MGFSVIIETSDDWGCVSIVFTAASFFSGMVGFNVSEIEGVSIDVAVAVVIDLFFFYFICFNILYTSDTLD